MHIEFTKLALFGKRKTTYIIEDEVVKCHDKAFPISQIIGVELNKDRKAIEFIVAGMPVAFKDLETLATIAIENSSVGEGLTNANPVHMGLTALRSLTHKGYNDDYYYRKLSYGSFYGHIEFDSQEEEAAEAYDWLFNHSKAKEFAEILGKLIDEWETSTNSNPNGEIRKQCNVCGTVFCYTADDIKAGARQAKANVFRGMMQVGGLMSGNMGAAIYGNQAIKEIVDFTRCPNCNSTDLSDYVGQIPEIEAGKAETATNTASAADEIRKFKELLDDGIITEDEYAAKKAQLLGL